MQVSVIVPVYNGERTLGDLLEALAAQTYPQERTQILVIDNNSVDRTSAIVAQWAGRRVLYLTCEKQGSYAARNVGIAHATGEILAFTDADCRPYPTWLQAAVEEFSANAVDRVAGVVTAPLSTPPRLWELVDATTYLLDAKMAEQGLVATSNLLIRRSVLEQVGHFEETVISGDDEGFGHRCNASGLSVHVSRNVQVSHAPRGALEQIRRSRRIGVGLAQITREPIVQRVAAHWRDLLPGASLAGVKRADLADVMISRWRWYQVRLVRYLAVDLVRSAGHLWGRWVLRHGRADQTLARISRSG